MKTALSLMRLLALIPGLLLLDSPATPAEPAAVRRVGMFCGSLSQEERAALEAAMASPGGPVPAR